MSVILWYCTDSIIDLLSVRYRVLIYMYIYTIFFIFSIHCYFVIFRCSLLNSTAFLYNQTSQKCHCYTSCIALDYNLVDDAGYDVYLPAEYHCKIKYRNESFINYITFYNSSGLPNLYVSDVIY